MAMTVRYLTIDGEIVSETRNGVRSDYIPDPLGSTAALINPSHTITDTFLWWPFGEQKSHVGSSVTPFGYGGTLGYYSGRFVGWMYARRRIDDPRTTAWLTTDPFWPSTFAYVYAAGQPTGRTDPLGLFPRRRKVTSKSSAEERLALAAHDGCQTAYAGQSAGGSAFRARYASCMADSGYSCPPMDESKWKCLYSHLCNDFFLLVSKCAQCTENKCGETQDSFTTMCSYSLRRTPYCDHFNLGAQYHIVLIHEVLHTCGVDHPEGIAGDAKCNTIMACCMLRANGVLPPYTRCKTGIRNPG